MRNTIVAATVVALLALGIFTASGQSPAKPRGVLTVLQVGQSVTLKDADGRYEIGIFANGPDLLGYKVVEVGGDYLVVQDVAGVNELRIPKWGIRRNLPGGNEPGASFRLYVSMTPRTSSSMWLALAHRPLAQSISQILWLIC